MSSFSTFFDLGAFGPQGGTDFRSSFFSASSSSSRLFLQVCSAWRGTRSYSYIEGEAGVLAQADTQKRSAKHTRKRMNTSSHPFRTWDVLVELYGVCECALTATVLEHRPV